MDEPKSKKDIDDTNTDAEQRQNECKNITVLGQSTLSLSTGNTSKNIEKKQPSVSW